MGAHADDEAELGPRPVIVSLSLGATRRFVVTAKAGGKRLQLELENGSLLVMRGAMQARYKHAIPKSQRVTGARLNLTFRQVLSS